MECLGLLNANECSWPAGIIAIVRPVLHGLKGRRRGRGSRMSVSDMLCLICWFGLFTAKNSMCPSRMDDYSRPTLWSTLCFLKSSAHIQSHAFRTNKGSLFCPEIVSTAAICHQSAQICNGHSLASSVDTPRHAHAVHIRAQRWRFREAPLHTSAATSSHVSSCGIFNQSVQSDL